MRKFKKILITGSGGFVGSHLRSKLEDLGYEVFGLSQSNPRGNDFIGDVRKYPDLKKALAGMDAVFHLAGVSSAVAAKADPSLDFQTNVEGTFNILMACKECGVKKMVFSSTGYVYGKPKKIRVSEDFELIPNTYYGQSKLAAEEYCRYFSRQGLDVVIARLFNAYGKGQRQRVIPDLVSKMLMNSGKVEINGNAADSRDFLDVAQVTQALILLLEKGRCGEAYNVGSGVETSILDLSKMIALAIENRRGGKIAQFKYVYDKNTSSRIYADISKLAALGFSPTPISARGLEELVDELVIP